MTEFRFHVDRGLNLFCHTICLFPESYRSEGSAFNNAKYREKHSNLRQQALANLFSNLLQLGWADWDFVGLSLIDGSGAGGSSENRIRHGLGRLSNIWSAILEESWKGYGEMWPAIEASLTKYKSQFEDAWKASGEDVLLRVKRISEAEWDPKHIDVHLVDCLYGGASYIDKILIGPVSDFEIEKKLLSHELSETAFAVNGLQSKLQTRGINPGVFHTVVDTAAYLSVKPWLKSEYVERLKPKSPYYAETEAVYSAFEKCGAGSEAYLGLEEFLTVLAKEPG